MIGVAMLSRWHVHADDYALQAAAHPGLEIRAVWDEELERGRAWAKEMGVPFVTELAEVLADPAIDGVIVAAPTTRHKDIMLQAARSGKHIFSEKVLAPARQDCAAVLAEVREHGVHLMLSLKRLTDDYYVYAQAALDQGLLGRLVQVRCRLAHNGALPRDGKPYGILPETFFDPAVSGGGALIDLGAHPVYLTNRLAGKVKHLYARMDYSLGHAVEDSAVIVAEYASGALGIIEASLAASGTFLLELHGTEGTLIVEKGRPLRIRSSLLGDGSWQTPPLPPPLPSAMEQWVSQINEGTPPAITHDDFLELTAVIEAAARSFEAGGTVSLS
ncbi:Gfo/Idh/MocA family protein [Paenibacillus sp. 1P07SE]|uniref:Gfo/Idh/MocA family protein n=1 Tax=Paenibacillus sp. 1P07SE TaxID=3132209 RepID=UPI0039A42389